ncbi:MAG: enoyl-CoA hydratase/isomerase family protein [Chloroflexi bacterium]|nr:enoyl-CoA hydratase/isomerase family protein [Chloroflexota bacterium]
MAVTFEQRGRIAHVTLNRPEALNSMNQEMNAELMEAFTRIENDESIWVGIVRGSGDRAFCAGADLKEAARGGVDHHEVFWKTKGRTAMSVLMSMSKPMIAAVNGHALGGGLTIAIGCDMRVAATNATFGFPEVVVGLPTVIGSIRLPRVMPLGLALELLLGGGRIDAQEAHRTGLVNKVVPPAELDAAARELAERIILNGPLAVRLTKEIALRGLTLPFDDAVRLGESLRRISRDTADSKEGPKAFSEKRKPQYQGR